MSKSDESGHLDKTRMLWGFEITQIDRIGFYAMIAGAVLSGFGVAISLASSFVLYWVQQTSQLDADAKIAAANARGEEAKQLAASAQRETETLRAENLVLRAKIAPRRLTGEASRQLAEAVKDLAELPVVIVSRIMDYEGKDFADDINSALLRANLRTQRVENWTGNLKGVFFAAVKGTKVPEDLLNHFRRALQAAQIEFEVIELPDSMLQTAVPHFQQGVLYLLVGAKPLN